MALFDDKDVAFDSICDKWRIFQKVNENVYIVIKTDSYGNSVFNVMLFYSFQFAHPHWHTRADMFMYKYPTPETIPTTAERLIYYRYKNSLLQKDVAKAVGIDRTTYVLYENLEHKEYDLKVLQRIADLYSVDVVYFLDEYTKFLYDGQAKQIKELRKSLGLTQYKFGQRYGVSRRAVSRWESEQIKISKKVWKRIYKENCPV